MILRHLFLAAALLAAPALAQPGIERNIAAAGVGLREGRCILVSHAHFDHARGRRGAGQGDRREGADLIAWQRREDGFDQPVLLEKTLGGARIAFAKDLARQQAAARK